MQEKLPLLSTNDNKVTNTDVIERLSETLYFFSLFTKSHLKVIFCRWVIEAKTFIIIIVIINSVNFISSN